MRTNQMQKWWMSLLLTNVLWADPSKNTCSHPVCPCPSRALQLSPRYTSPKGIGYRTGYTSIDAFFTSEAPGHFLPFVDFRGHVLDNGKLAANAGLGLRYLSKDRVWGGNAYYDYRNTAHRGYSRIGVGVESLGTVWDARLNGYIPVGRQHWFQSTSVPAQFEGNFILLGKTRQEIALGGWNAEAGLHVDHFHVAPLYFAAGPYYLKGSGHTTWGGKVRGVVELFDHYVRLEANVAYDHLFKWTGQGQMSLQIPLGRTPKSSKLHAQDASLCKRLFQKIDREEIIPTHSERNEIYAIHPATGEPWLFWFVDNTSHSLGTYESPFPTLLEAQFASSAYQAIYVFPGDGTTQGMDAGIVLKQGQLLLDASFPQQIPTTQGTVFLPALALTSPHLTNTSGHVITLAPGSYNSTLQGFIISPQGNAFSGVFGDNPVNLTLSNNTFDGSFPANLNGNGVSLLNPSGSVVINGATFDTFGVETANSDGGNGVYVYQDANQTLSVLSLSQCIFKNMFINAVTPGGNGVWTNGGNISLLLVEDNDFSSFSNYTAFLNVSDIGIATFQNNSFSDLTNNSVFINASQISEFAFQGNSFNNLNGSTVFFNRTQISELTAQNNSFSNFNGSNTFLNAGQFSVFVIQSNNFSNIISSEIITNYGLVSSLLICDNSVNNSTNSGIFYNAYNIESISIYRNTFNNFISNVLYNLGTVGSLAFLGNTVANFSADVLVNYNSIGSLTIQGGNIFENIRGNAVYLPGSTANLTVQGNTFNQWYGNNAVLNLSSGHIQTATITDNNFSSMSSNALYNQGAITSLTIQGNNFSGFATSPIFYLFRGGSIGTMTLQDNIFNGGAMSALYNTGSISSLVAQGNMGSGFSGGAILNFLTLGTSGSVGSMALLDNHFSNNTAYGLYNTSPIQSLKLDGNSFSQWSKNPVLYLSPASSIISMTASNNNWSGVSGFGFYNSGKVTSLDIEGNILSGITGTGFYNAGGVTALTISGNNLTGIAGTGVYNSGSVYSLNLSKNTFSGISGTAVYNSGAIGSTFSMLNNTFSGITGYGFYNTGTISSSLVVQGNTSTGLNRGYGFNIAGLMPHLTIQQNTLSALNNSVGMLYTQGITNTNAMISSNTFTGGSSLTAGYAVRISAPNPKSNLCLQFTNNNATAPGGGTAYVFSAVAGATFNRTLNSTGNTGTFQVSPQVGSLGSCTYH